MALSNLIRPVGQLARESLALADASNGRAILGITSGWGTEEYTAFGNSTQRSVSRFAETLKVLPRLLEGEKVDFDGEFLHFARAHLFPTTARPPIWVAAFGPRMISLAARYADGWNSAWHGISTSRFEDELALLRASLAEIGRADSTLTITAGLRAIPLTGDELAEAGERAERLTPKSDPPWWATPIRTETLTGTAEEMASAALKFVDLGADHLIIAPTISPYALFDTSFIERCAAMLPLLTGTPHPSLTSTRS
jgi:alkanesulfonate monooxygenase SsuD/methylene tetrahydromethanopterin reductase-like flavin-dependent oxidoreductase (luciferase family)